MIMPSMKRNTLTLVLLVLTVPLALPACGDTDLLGPGVLVYSRLGEATFSNAPEGLEFSIEYPAEVDVGDPVRVRLALTNVSDGPMEIRHGLPGPEFDLVITTPDSVVVWEYQWTQRFNSNDAAGHLTLEAGESIRGTLTWDQTDLRDGSRASPGEYLVRGVFIGNKHEPGYGWNIWTEPAPLTIR
jgi:hypothetical protein